MKKVSQTQKFKIMGLSQDCPIGVSLLGLLMVVLIAGQGMVSAQDFTNLGNEELGMTMEELVEIVEEVEPLIAECMTDAGFEYIAVDFNTVRKGMLADKAMPDLAERDFKAKYGFGISTLYTDGPPQLALQTDPGRIGLGEQNVQIFLSLSPADQVAYNRTLLGEFLTATFARTIESEDFSLTGGCTREALEQVLDPEELTVSYRNPKDVLMDQDPRMITALDQYASCLREAGYEFTHPEQVEPDVQKRFDELTGGLPMEALSDKVKEEVKVFQEEEIKLVLASYDCEHKYIHPVQDALENE